MWLFRLPVKLLSSICLYFNKYAEKSKIGTIRLDKNNSYTLFRHPNVYAHDLPPYSIKDTSHHRLISDSSALSH